MEPTVEGKTRYIDLGNIFFLYLKNVFCEGRFSRLEVLRHSLTHRLPQ